MNRYVLKIVDDRRDIRNDVIADEAFLTIQVDGRELVTLSCTPERLKELTAGFLYSSGLIRALDDIGDLFIDGKELTADVALKNRMVDDELLFSRFHSSGCGRGAMFMTVMDYIDRNTVTGTFTMSARDVSHMMKEFNKRSETFRRTGGVHSAALCDNGRIAVFCEDIGRHNAIDKVIGEALYRDLDMVDMLFMTSGRISSDVVYKVRRTGSPMIVSRSAPTSIAVEYADRCGITLVGFARGNAMNVYTAGHRIA